MPRNNAASGQAAAKAMRTRVAASAMAPADRPRFQYLSEKSPEFGRWLNLIAHRNDDFFQVAAGGIDLCAARVPVPDSTTCTIISVISSATRAQTQSFQVAAKTGTAEVGDTG